MPASPAPAQPPAKSPSPKPSGIDAFPSLDSPGPVGEVRVTGAAGTGDEEMAQFESSFPDLSGEVGYEQVSWASRLPIRYSRRLSQLGITRRSLVVLMSLLSLRPRRSRADPSPRSQSLTP